VEPRDPWLAPGQSVDLTAFLTLADGIEMTVSVWSRVHWWLGEHGTGNETCGTLGEGNPVRYTAPANPPGAECSEEGYDQVDVWVEAGLATSRALIRIRAQ
jgi:hypothetical protein